jgi:hypothetical protein
MLNGVELSDWHMWWKRRGAKGIRRLLMEEWDPIGVNGVEEAVDEYDGYLGPIGERLRSGASVEEVASYLTHVREDRMDLGPTGRERDTATAAHLVDWYSGEMATDAE